MPTPSCGWRCRAARSEQGEGLSDRSTAWYELHGRRRIAYADLSVCVSVWDWTVGLLTKIGGSNFKIGYIRREGEGSNVTRLISTHRPPTLLR